MRNLLSPLTPADKIGDLISSIMFGAKKTPNWKTRRKLKITTFKYWAVFVLLMLVSFDSASVILDNIRASNATEFVSPVSAHNVQIKEILKQVEVPVIVRVYSESTENWIAKYSKQYEVPQYFAHCVFDAESDYIADAVGDGGKAVGMGQFHCPTWQSVRNKMGENPDCSLRADAEEAVKTTIYGLANGWKYHWSPVNDGRCRIIPRV